MSDTALWIAAGFAVWCVVSVPAALVLGRVLRARNRQTVQVQR